jgi:hypothetical protein
LADFLRAYGDDLPERTIREATKDLNRWQVACDCETGDIISAARALIRVRILPEKIYFHL